MICTDCSETLSPSQASAFDFISEGDTGLCVPCLDERIAEGECDEDIIAEFAG